MQYVPVIDLSRSVVDEILCICSSLSVPLVQVFANSLFRRAVKKLLTHSNNGAPQTADSDITGVVGGDRRRHDWEYSRSSRRR